jgi:hypothetical protein
VVHGLLSPVDPDSRETCKREIFQLFQITAAVDPGWLTIAIGAHGACGAGELRTFAMWPISKSSPSIPLLCRTATSGYGRCGIIDCAERDRPHEVCRYSARKHLYSNERHGGRRPGPADIRCPIPLAVNRSEWRSSDVVKAGQARGASIRSECSAPVA